MSGLLALALLALVAGCSGGPDAPEKPEIATTPLSEAALLDHVHGAWATIMVANHSGLPIEGVWLDEPGPGDSVELVLLDEWSTDDDTHVEWLHLHVLETHGLSPSYEQIRDEWVDHLNGDIWVATRAARDLMDTGVLPPETGRPPGNPEGAWSMDAQLETELFGMLHPGRPERAREQARFFAQVTNVGPAVDASAFYAHLYAMAFHESDPAVLIAHARAAEPEDSIVAPIVDDVIAWHEEAPDDWRATRARIAQVYDDDPEWWASRVNFAVTIMALLYGDGDLRATLDIAGLAGWDADNNMTTSAGLIGLAQGFDALPEPFASASDVYFNEDLTGDLPQFDSVRSIAERTTALAIAGGDAGSAAGE